MVRRRNSSRASRGGGRNSKIVKGALIIEEEDEDRKFAKPSTISPHLFCPICTDVFNKPFRAPCGHSFCRSCVEPWLLTQGTCPIDRKSIRFDDLHHDFILQNIIGDYTAACPWRSLGCNYIGPLHLLSSHKKSCVMNPDHLPEALRVREVEILQRANSSSQLSTYNGFPSAPEMVQISVPSVPAQPVISKNANGNEVVIDTLERSALSLITDEEEELPPVPLPSLLLRLYQKSDAENRDLMCSFFSESSTAVSAPHPKRRKTRATSAGASGHAFN